MEGASFTVSGTQTVRYGAGTSWVQRTVTSAGNCTNAFFGRDPLENTVKACQLLSTATSSSPGTTTPDMLGEWADCRLPQRIQFVRERQGPWWPGPFGVTRKEQYAGGPLETKAAKNPEAHDAHGPGHSQNCTPGAAAGKDTQWLSFKFQSTNYFGSSPSDASAVGDHLAILMRAKFGPSGFVVGPYGRASYIQTPQYHARGIIFHRASGVQAEHYSLAQPSGRQTLQAGAWSTRLHPLVLRDGVTYTVNVIASDTSVSYQVIEPSGNASIFWSPASTWHETPDGTFVAGPATTNARTTGTGFGVGVLCNPASVCGGQSQDETRPFTIDLTEISGGWF